MKNYLKQYMRSIMKKQDKYKIKDIVQLEDDKEYSIIKQVNNYYVFLSLEQPLTIFVGKIKNDNIEIIEDKNIIEMVLSS